MTRFKLPSDQWKHFKENGEFDDLAFLKDIEEWPYMGDCDTQYCVLRRSKDNIVEKAFLLSENNWNLFLGNIFDGGTGEIVEFQSPEAILFEGWSVS